MHNASIHPFTTAPSPSMYVFTTRLIHHLRLWLPNPLRPWLPNPLRPWLPYPLRLWLPYHPLLPTCLGDVFCPQQLHHLALRPKHLCGYSTYYCMVHSSLLLRGLSYDEIDDMIWHDMSRSEEKKVDWVRTASYRVRTAAYLVVVLSLILEQRQHAP